LEHIRYYNLPTSQEHSTNGAAGDAKIGPRGSEQQVANKMWHWTKQLSNWLQNGSHNLKVWRTFDYIFNVFTNHFLGWLLNDFVDRFGINLRTFFMI